MEIDYRASLIPKGSTINSIEEVLGINDSDNIMQPLWTTGGVLFPYSPIITGSGTTANYDTLEFTHSNYPQNVFKNSTPNDINISAKFTAQTTSEAWYMLAVIFFFRSVTKMHFGESATSEYAQVTPGLGSFRSTKAGLPPPVLYFNYLGKQMFNAVPVVVKTFEMDLPDNVDYVPIKRTSEDISYVPSMATFNIVLSPQYNPLKVQQDFNLDAFKEGSLLDKGFI